MSDCNELRDCIKDPISKKCTKFCLERVLRKATVEEKMLILGHTTETANAIFKAYQGHTINSFEDLSSWLTPDQQNEILTKFSFISQFQIDYFQLAKIERDPVVEAIKGLGLNMNDTEFDLVTS